MARSLGVEVVALDMSQPFTAARARNAGFARLQAIAPGLRWVQFVDGDCELDPGWLPAAAAYLAAHDAVVVVCGRLRERRPESSLYNSLCDDEWAVPPGPALACGGIAMYRLTAFVQAGGFNEGLIAGEEPELCLRLRRNGGAVVRLPNEMGWHDAAMFHMSQWWQRSRRYGFASANAFALHGRGPERLGWVPLRRALLWAVGLPVAALLLGWALHPMGALAVLALYPLQWLRLGWRSPRTRAWRWHKAGLAVLGRFAEAHGAWTYYLNHRRQRQMTLIEYK
jgi:GT2 family glycosyltransferase